MNYMNLQSKEEVKMKSVERLCLDGTLLGKSLLGGNFAWRRLCLEAAFLGGDFAWKICAWRGQKLMAAPSH